MKTNRSRDGPTAKVFRALLMSFLLVASIIALLNVGSGYVEALDPHIVTGTVYQANGTVFPSANVTIVNVRTGETSNTTSNGTGIYAFNLLNLPKGWAFGDMIQVNTTNATGVGGSNATNILIDTTSTIIDIWIGSTTRVTGVSFYIIDGDGYPVGSVMINIKDNAGDIVTTKMTDSDGKASTTLDDGLYTITISKSGYDDVIKTIRVHGCTYSIRLAGYEAVGVTTPAYLFWALVLFALVGIMALLIYLAKKV